VGVGEEKGKKDFIHYYANHIIRHVEAFLDEHITY